MSYTKIFWQSEAVAAMLLCKLFWSTAVILFWGDYFVLKVTIYHHPKNGPIFNTYSFSSDSSSMLITRNWLSGFYFLTTIEWSVLNSLCFFSSSASIHLGSSIHYFYHAPLCTYFEVNSLERIQILEMLLQQLLSYAFGAAQHYR